MHWSFSRSAGALLIAMGIAFSWVLTGSAQSTTGTILGTVKDQSDAVLPGATVKVTNVDTGIVRTTVAGNNGGYRIQALAVGAYEVQVEMSGFQIAVRKGITLSVGQDAVVDFALQVGNVTEQVTVTGEAPLIETTTATVSGLVDSKQMRDIPLNGRSFLELIPLQTGAVFAETGGQSVDVGFSKKISVVGTRYNSNVFLLDGANINDMSGSAGNASGGIAGVETVREFRVITNAYDAEYGNHTGGVISAITKSGTNQFHGSLFEFLRNDKLDAAKWEDNKFGNPKPAFKRNQYGAAVGGPIRHDRTFFFGSYEGTREGLGQTTSFIVPGAAMRAGILPGSSPGSLLPAIAISPVTNPFLQSFPAPNTLCAANCLNSQFPYDLNDGTARFVRTRTQVTNEDYWTGRIDHRLSDADSLFGRLTWDNSERDAPALAAISISSTANRFATLEETHIFSPALLNRTNLSFVRTNFDALPGLIPGYPFPKPTFNGQPLPGGAAAFDGSNAVGSYTVASLSGLGGTDPKIFIVNTWQFKEDMFWTRGRHSLKFGAHFQRYQFNQRSDFNSGGSYTFPNYLAFLQDQATVFDTVRPGSDNVRGWRQSLLGLYVQDDFNLRPGLTLNVGLLYETIGMPIEVNGKMANIRDITPAHLAVVQQNQTDVGAPYLKNPSKLNFAPRLGVAWSPFGSTKTSVRAGVGIYYDEIQPGAYEVPGNRAQPYYAVAELLSGVTPGPQSIDFPVAYFSQRPLLVNSNGTTPQIDGIEYNTKQPTVYKWSLDVSRQVGKDATFEVGYSGTRGVHLLRGNLQLNSTPSTFIGGSRFILITQPLPDPNWGRVRWRLWDGSSIYHGLRLGFNKRFGAGLQIQTSYTFSKSIDNGSAFLGTGDFTNENIGYGTSSLRALSSFDVRYSFYTNFTYDLPFGKKMTGLAGGVLGGWSTSGLLRLNSGPPLNVTAQNPTVRLTVNGVATTYSYTNVTGSTVNLIPGGKLNAVNSRNPDLYFDPKQYSPVVTCLLATCNPIGAFQGNVGPDTLPGPGIANLDLSLVKDTKLSRLHEGVVLQFRTELFNVLNHVNYSNPATVVFNSTGIPLPTAGQVTTTRTVSRQLQFALKLLF